MSSSIPDPRLSNVRHDTPTLWEKAVKTLLTVISAATVITAISTTILMFDALND
jgi:hypothetical protein